MGEGQLGDGQISVRLREMLEYIEEQVRRGDAAGIDFSEVEEMLAAARVMIDTGELDDAAELLNTCIQKASQRSSEFDRLMMGIRKAEKSIKEAHDSGRDVVQACTHLRLAREHLERGEYIMGMESAKLASEAAMKKAHAEIAWGSGLSETSVE